MVDDLISRQAAIDVVKGIDSYFVKYIEELPSAQPEIDELQKEVDYWHEKCTSYEQTIVRLTESAQRTGRKRGKFIGTEYDGYADGNPVYYEWKCSECGCIFEDEEPTYNYCPNCGARMEETDERT